MLEISAKISILNSKMPVAKDIMWIKKHKNDKVIHKEPVKASMERNQLSLFGSKNSFKENK